MEEMIIESLLEVRRSDEFNEAMEDSYIDTGEWSFELVRFDFMVTAKVNVCSALIS